MEQLFFTSIIISVILVIVEEFIIVIGVTSYYKIGIKLFSREGKLSPNYETPLKEEELKKAIPKSPFSHICISEFTKSNVFAVREMPFGLKFNYPPLIRGLIIYTTENKGIKLEGRLNNSPILLIASFICFIISSAPDGDYLEMSIILFSLILSIVLAIIFTQRDRYLKIFKQLIE